MSDIEFVVKRSKILEGRLRRELNAEGNGLGELARNVKPKLPSETFDQIEKVDEMRNVIVHEEGRNQLNNKPEFNQLYKNIERSLNKLKRSNRPPEWEGGVVVIGLMMITLIIYFLSQNLL